MSAGTTVQITMPEMGESVTEGTVLEWLKQVGDEVEADEGLLEVSTDKVDTEVPSPASGVLTEILVGPDETVPTGTVLGIIDVSGSNGGAPRGHDDLPTGASDFASGESAVEEAEHGAAAEEEHQAAKERASGNGAPAAQAGQVVDVTVPEMGESVSEGTVLEWLKQVGDRVEVGEGLVEISTDKVDAELPSPVSGTVAEILAQPDDVVATGSVVCRVAVGEGAPKSKPAAPAPAGEPKSAEPEPAGNGDANATPVAARMANAHGIDPSTISGSGPRGRVTKEDVEAAIEGNGAPQSTGPPTTDHRPPTTSPIRGPAATLAKFMNESRTIPTATSFRTLQVDTLDHQRKALKAAGQKLSFTHLIAWAIVHAATEMPVMANAYAEENGTPQRVTPEGVSLGLAVDVERKDGTRSLVVPVVRQADRLGFRDFVAKYDELVAGARDNTLPPDAYAGANITLTNPGGIGTVASVPRLMPGQGTIVATGAISYPPGFANADQGRIKELGISKVMTMTSTYDHRVIQGAESGSFLRRIDQLLQGEDGFYALIFEALGVRDGGPPPGVEERRQDGAGPVTAAEPAPSRVRPGITAVPDEALLQAVQAATSLVKAHRMHGHLAADLDPLGSKPLGDPALDPTTVNLTPELMEAIPASVLRVAVPGDTFADALPHLQETYTGTISYEIEHISDHEQRVWLRQAIESSAYRTQLEPEFKRTLLDQLSAVEALETYLHKAFLGRKQFSIEGLDVLVPMLDETIELSSDAGAREVVLGMAHRGRLNVLAHTVGKSYESILVEFEGESNLEADTAIPEGGTGDVKYHHGASGTYKARNGKRVRVTLSPNPSHLEFVDPVVEGRSRADQTSRDGREISHDPTVVMPVLIHGDAAFPAQGIVAETFNLQAVDGYSTGGTLHIITNNQLGFTTDPEEGRSTRYASDLAKGFDAPIVHVNADDVEACISSVRLAMAFREKFGRDVVIDLIGYRRFGHNEQDEPAYTQPTMYEVIKHHPPVRKLYADRLATEGVVTPEDAETFLKNAQAALSEAHEELREAMARDDTAEHELDRSASPEPRTAVPEDVLRGLNEQLLKVPDDFSVHRKLQPQLERRRSALDEGAIDWAQAESLAWASLLTQGIPIRLTGQDTERGTFSQRHLVLHDARNGKRHSPIQRMPQARAPFELHNSPLSEQACLAFEYGYSVQAPEALVLWEAQFGDFVNGAQVIVDQFLVSGLAKWGQTTRLTLLLPHGYEGSGPEHSSGRVERFLQLGAEGNIRVANCTTPAQYFHLLRRQALIQKRRPLIVMTPKSLLRHPAAASGLADLVDGSFKPVLDDPSLPGSREEVKRLVLCSGKLYYDLAGHETRPEARDVAIGRVELLYPFPENELRALMESFPALEQVIWAQEEPKNMGARAVMEQRLAPILPDGVVYDYIGRQLRASPGEGYAAAHRAEQNRIVRAALGLPE